MSLLLQVFLIIFPAALVLFVSWFVISKMMHRLSENEEKSTLLLKDTLDSMTKMEVLRNDAKNRAENQKILTPICLQANERLILFLERMRIDSIILRTNRPGMNILNMQASLVQSVREEFEHNLSQQLYVSNQVWKAICDSREEFVSLVNLAASQLPSESKGEDLAQKMMIFLADGSQKKLPKAILLLKEEMRQNY